MLETFSVFSVMLFLGIGDPFVPLNAFRIGLELLGDLLDIFRFPTSNLDKRVGAHLIEGLCVNRPDPVNLLQIVFLTALIDLRLSSLGTHLGSIRTSLRRHDGDWSRFRAKDYAQVSEAFLQAIDLFIFLWDTPDLLDESVTLRLKRMQLTVEARNLLIPFMQTLLVKQLLHAELLLCGALLLKLRFFTFKFLHGTRVSSFPFFEF